MSGPENSFPNAQSHLTTQNKEYIPKAKEAKAYGSPWGLASSLGPDACPKGLSSPRTARSVWEGSGMRGRDPAPPTPGVGRLWSVEARGSRVWPCLEFVLSEEEAGSAQALGAGGEELGLRKGLSSRSVPKDLEPEGAAGEGHLHPRPAGPARGCPCPSARLSRSPLSPNCRCFACSDSDLSLQEIRSAPALQASSTLPLTLQARDDPPWFTLPGALLLGPAPSPDRPSIASLETP